MNLRKPILEKYGYTIGCKACDGMAAGRSKIPCHSEGCRKRIMDAMAADEEGQRRIARDQARRRTFERDDDASEEQGSNKKSRDAEPEAVPS